MLRLVTVVLVVLGFGLTGGAARAGNEILLRPGEIDKLAGTNLECLNNDVSVLCGELIQENSNTYGFPPGTIYLSINEGSVSLLKDPSGGLGKPPLLPVSLAGGPLPTTLTQPQGTLRMSFTPGGSLLGGDWGRPQWETGITSDLIIRDNVDATGRVFIFASKYSYPSAHVQPDSTFAMLSETDARVGHYTGLAGQIDSTFQQPRVPLSFEVDPIVTDMIANELHTRIGLPKWLQSRAGRIDTIIFKMEASLKWSDDVAICGASHTFSVQVGSLAVQAKKTPHTPPLIKHELSFLKHDAGQLTKICK